MLVTQQRFAFSFLVFSLFLIFLVPNSSDAADIGNCLLCHKYPGLSRIDKDGNLRLLFINEGTFNNSVHAKIKCEGCHTDIKKIPHDPVKKVDCLTQCHIIEPTSEQKFSHKEVTTLLAKSVHGELDSKGKQKRHLEDLPSCKNCHDNPLYRPLSFFKRVRPGISDRALGRCRVCHKKDDFIISFYNHVTTRLHTTRSPKNIAEMCGRCHDDRELGARHDLTTRATFSYGETFHGKAANFLDERVPDCLDCHVNRGQSVHEMLTYKDPQSSTYQANKAATCTNMECHPKASPKLADYKVHAEYSYAQNPLQYYFRTLFLLLTGGTLLPLLGLMGLDLIRRLFPNARTKRNR